MMETVAVVFFTLQTYIQKTNCVKNIFMISNATIKTSPQYRKFFSKLKTLPHQRGVSNVVFIATVSILALALIVAISIIIGSNRTELPARAEPATTSDIGNNSTENVAGTPAENTETQTRDNKAAQILTSKRYEPVPETIIEVPTDNGTDVRTNNYADAPTSTPSATESLDDTVGYANKSAREIAQQDAFVSDTGTSYRGIEFNPEPNYSTADYAAPESNQSEPVRPESSATSTIENPNSQTKEYVPGSRTFCGVTEVEFYEWFKMAPNAAWEFIWNCDDI